MTLFVVVLSMLAAPADSAKTHLDNADASFVAGDVDGARRDVDEALAVDPQNPDALLAAARLARRTGEPEVAVQRLTELLRADPDDDDARYELALAQAELGEKVNAGSTLDGLLAREPQRKDALEAKNQLTTGADIDGTDTGGFHPLARVALGATYDSNVQLASSKVPSETDKSTPTVDVDAAAGFGYGRTSQLGGARPFMLVARLTNQTSTTGNDAIQNVVPATLGLIAVAQQRAGTFQLALDMRYTEIFVDSFSDHVQRLLAPSVWVARQTGVHVFRLLGGVEYRDTSGDATVTGPDNVTYEAALRDTMTFSAVQLTVDARGAINKANGDGNGALVDFKEVAAFAYAWVPIVKSFSAFGLGEVAGRKFDAGTKETMWRAEAGARYAFDIFELHAEYAFMKNVSSDARSFDRHLVSGGIRIWYQ